MIKDTDVKYYIAEELDLIKQRIEKLENYAKTKIKHRSDKKRVLRSLRQVEKGTIKAMIIIGEG